MKINVEELFKVEDNYDDFYISENGYGHYFNDNSLDGIPYIPSKNTIKRKLSSSMCDCGGSMKEVILNCDNETCSLCGHYVVWG